MLRGASLLALLLGASPAERQGFCLRTQKRCHERIVRCNAGDWQACARARSCIESYERRCEPWVAT